MRAFRHRKVATIFENRSNSSTHCPPAPKPRTAWILCLLLINLPAAAEPDVGLKTERQIQLRKELALIDKLEKIENEQGPLATDSIAPLLDLSLMYVAQDRCPDAISMLNRGIRVSQVAYGLFNTEQLELIEPGLECYLALELPEEFRRQQEYSLLIG